MIRTFTSFVLAITACGCGSPPAEQPKPAALPGPPQRIVSTAPSNTEVLFAVGAGDRVVGVTTYCTYPPEALRIEKIGGFSPKAISAERIVGLRPDLVLTTGRIQQSFAESLKKLGLEVRTYDAMSLDDVLRDIRAIGADVGRADAANELADSLAKRREAVKTRSSVIPFDFRPRVLLLLSDDPLMTAGPKSMVGQMLDEAGGVNLFPEATQTFPRISEEEIIRRNPDVISIWEMGDSAARIARVAARPGWDRLNAVKNGRILHIHDDYVSRQSPRLFEGLEKLADLLHPK